MHFPQTHIAVNSQGQNDNIYYVFYYKNMLTDHRRKSCLKISTKLIL